MLLIFHFAIDASVSLSINGSDFFLCCSKLNRGLNSFMFAAYVSNNGLDEMSLKC